MVDVVDDEGMSALMRVCEDEDKCDVEKVSDLLSQGASPLIACPPHRLNSLHISAIAGHAPILTLLVQKVPDAVDVKDARGMTALHFAAKYSREQAAKVLLQANANKDAQSDEGFAPCDYAANSGCLPLLEHLVGLGCQLGPLEGVKPFNPVVLAAEGGHLAVLSWLVGRGLDHLKPDWSGLTPLYVASQAGHDDVVRFLLDRGADPAWAAEGGATALHVAVQSKDGPGGDACTDLLLSRGASARAASQGGVTPLHLASGTPGALNRVKSLIKAGADVHARVQGQADFSALHLAAERGEEAIIAALLEAGAQPDALTSGTRTSPLHIAARAGHGAAARALLAGGADPTLPTSQGATPLGLSSACGFLDTVKAIADALPARKGPEAAHAALGEALVMAARGGHAEVVRALLAAGADPVPQTPASPSALLFACEKGDAGVITLLLDALGSVQAPAAAATPSPLHVAASYGHANAITLLLSKGHPPAPRCVGGVTPLHFATQYKRPEAVAALLGGGCPPNELDEAGCAPLHFAAALGATEIAEMLVGAGADKCIRNKQGQTASDLAGIQGHSHLKEMLQG